MSPHRRTTVLADWRAQNVHHNDACAPSFGHSVYIFYLLATFEDRCRLSRDPVIAPLLAPLFRALLDFFALKHALHSGNVVELKAECLAAALDRLDDAAQVTNEAVGPVLAEPLHLHAQVQLLRVGNRCDMRSRGGMSALEAERSGAEEV